MNCVCISCQRVPWLLQDLAGYSKIWGSLLEFPHIVQLKMFLC